jgi:signal transduction histidine kinase
VGSSQSRSSASREKLKTITFSSGAFIIIAVSLAFFFLSLGKPTVGIELSLVNGEWLVSNVNSTGLASQAGVHIGDRPVEVNYQPAQIFLEPYTRAGKIDARLINEVGFLNSQGQLIKVSRDEVQFFGPAFMVQLSTITFCLIFWVMGLYVFFRGKKNSPELLLGLGSLIFGLMLCTNLDGTQQVANQVSIVLAIIGPWLFLHFFLILPEERSGLRRNPWLYLIYLPPAITMVLFFLMGWDQGQPAPGFRNVRFLEIGIGLAATLGVAVFNLFHTLSFRTRQQMRIMLVGCLAALVPFLCLYLLPYIVSGKSIVPVAYSIIFIVFIPISMGYAVVTQKLMDIDVFIRRTVIYGLVTFIMAAVLSIGIFLIIKSPYDFSIVEEGLLALVLGAVATALFGPAKNGIEKLIDKVFFKDRYDYGTIIQGLATSLKNQSELTDVSRLIVGTVFQALNLAGACLFLRSRNGNLFVSSAQGSFIDSNKQGRMLYLLSHRKDQVEFPNPASSVDPDLSFLIPLATGKIENGFLLISPKASRQEFSANDIYLLQGVASVASVSLHSNMLAHDVSARDTFVSIASHELHTPLAGLMGYVSLLLKKERSEEQRKQWLRNISDCGVQLTEIVDDLLNVSRIQTGRIDLKPQPVNVASIIEDRLFLVREDNEKYKFITDIETDLPCAWVDPTKFGLVIANLLSNAVKYSPNGGLITVAARYDRTERQVVVSVADQGMGIAPENISSLFKPFSRIDRPETEAIKGVGMGLYITKEWIEAMGGKVRLKSELNQGSTFYVAIPVPA